MRHPINTRPTVVFQILQKFRIAFFCAVIASAILIMLYCLNRNILLNSVDRLLLTEHESRLILLRGAIAAMPDQDADGVMILLRSAQEASPNPGHLDLIDGNGSIVASTDDSRIGASWSKPGPSGENDPSLGLTGLKPTVSIDPATGRITGVLPLQISEPSAEHTRGAFLYSLSDASASRQRTLDSLDFVLLWETFGIPLFIGVGGLFMHFEVNDRVSSLLDALNRFKSGDLRARTHCTGKGSIAQVGSCIDRLLDRVVRERTEIQFSEARIKAVLETATDGIISIDSKGRIFSMNSAAERIFGYASGEAIGKKVEILMPPPFSTQHQTYIEEYLQTGREKIIGIGREVNGVRSDGTVFPMELAVSALEFGDEKSFTGIVRDISARKRTEEQLRMSEEQLQLTVENAPIGIVTCDLDCRILNANRACSKIVGYPREELLKMEFTDLVHPEERGRCLEFTKRAKDNRLESSSIQQRWLHKNGSDVLGVLHVGVINNDEGVAQMFVIQMEDYTDQLNAEAEARQLRDRIAHVARITMLGEMVAGIAHEINQPLAAIANYTDASQRLIRSGNADPEDLMHAMKQASAQAHRAAQVLQRLRDFAKMRSVQSEKVDLNALIKDVVVLANMENPNLRSHIRLEFQDDLPELEADPIQIQQVILNLIRNGFDAMQGFPEDDQRLVIRTMDENGKSVRIEIVDRGSGVSRDSTDKIFDPFFSTKLSGMGLGLSICRSIARSHGGQLEFKNNPDRGATFFLRLPTLKN